jgi:hypothetical protein
MTFFEEKARALAEGAFDLHTHSVPSHFPRALDDFALLREADALGFSGIMLKNHYESTAGRAAIANMYAGTGTRAYGGIALNWPAGGINPYAVEACLRMGGQMVWMPTFDSAHFMNSGKFYQELFRRPGLSVFNNQGELVPAVYEIFEIVKKHDVFLATGHLSAEESAALCKAGIKEKVKMILTHPDFKRTFAPFALQEEMADWGVIVEKAWFNVCIGDTGPQAFAASIKKLGKDRVFLVTDRGQANAENPTTAFLDAVASLLENGLTEDEIDSLVRKVPRSIIKG